MTRLDPSHEEAARSLGAGPWRAFRTVVLPQLRPPIAAGALLVGLYTLSDFGAVSLMRFDVLTRAIYTQYQGRIDRTPAAVLSLVLVILALVILAIERRTRPRGIHSSRRPARPTTLIRLTTPQHRSGTIFLGSLVGLGVVVPATVLVAWLVRGLGRDQEIGLEWGALAGSISGATLAALLAMLAAIPVAVLVVRHQSPWSRFLQRSVYVIFSLPHIAVALAIVFFGAKYLGAFYQSLTVLVIAYATIFLAQASGAAEAALGQVDPQLEDAAPVTRVEAPDRALQDHRALDVAGIGCRRRAGVSDHHEGAPCHPAAATDRFRHARECGSGARRAICSTLAPPHRRYCSSWCRHCRCTFL